MSAERPTPEEMADYLTNNYGICTMGAACRCLQCGWHGATCPNWRPAAKSLGELRAAQTRYRNG